MDFNYITDVNINILKGIKELEIFYPDTDDKITIDVSNINSELGYNQIINNLANYGITIKAGNNSYLSAETYNKDIGIRTSDGSNYKNIIILSPSNTTNYNLRFIETDYKLEDNLVYNVVIRSTIDGITWTKEIDEMISNISQTAMNSPVKKKSAKYQDYVSMYLLGEGEVKLICNGPKTISSKMYTITISSATSNTNIEYTDMNIVGITTDGFYTDKVQFNLFSKFLASYDEININNLVTLFSNVQNNTLTQPENVYIGSGTMPNSLFKISNIIGLNDILNQGCLVNSINTGQVIFTKDSFICKAIQIVSSHKFIKTDSFKVVGNGYDINNNCLANIDINTNRYLVTDKMILFIQYLGNDLYKTTSNQEMPS